MKKITLTLMMVVLGLTAYAQEMETTAQDSPQAQELKFGYLSYEAAFQSMPEYATMKANMAQLRDQYEAEQKRVADDFNKKYEEFLDGQSTYPQTILQKRQSELQEILDKNVAFKKESLRLLKQSEDEAQAPLKDKLNAVLAKIGQERGFAFILNIDGNAAPWINTSMGVNITDAVIEALNAQ